MWCTATEKEEKLTRRGTVSHDGNIEVKSVPERRLSPECILVGIARQGGSTGRRRATASLRRM